MNPLLRSAVLCWMKLAPMRHVRVHLPYLSPRIRHLVLRKWGAEIDPTATLHTPCFVENLKPLPVGGRLHVGPGAYIGGHALLDLKGGIRIGANVTIAWRITITTHFDVGKSSIQALSPPAVAPVTIGDNVYIGSNVTLLPGVTLGEGCMIAAGSVVTHDVPPGMLAAGVPAKVIKKVGEK